MIPARLSNLLGLPTLPIVTLPHPLASRSQQAICALARDAKPRILEAVRRGGEVQDSETEIPARSSLPGDPHLALEGLHERGWTDGLPVALPTVDAVMAMMEATGTNNELMPPVPPAYTRSALERWAATWESIVRAPY